MLFGIILFLIYLFGIYVANIEIDNWYYTKEGDWEYYWEETEILKMLSVLSWFFFPIFILYLLYDSHRKKFL